MSYMIEEDKQKEHYDDFLKDYDISYGDRYSMKYRNEILHKKMFENINLANLYILDAMCGSGFTTGYLMEHNANIVGLDISEQAISKYKLKFPFNVAHCRSILSTQFSPNTFDMAIIIGGLHHLHPNLDDGISEVCRILKEGGKFCFLEPYEGSILDKFRKIWYRHDKTFLDNEKAIDLISLKKKYKDKFNFISEDYGGSLGYFFVLQSLVLKIPTWLKNLYSPVLILFDKCINPYIGRRFGAYVICQWEKKELKEDGG